VNSVGAAMQLTRDLQDKRLHSELSDGEVAEINVLVVSECSQHEDCRGLVYDVVATNRPDRVRKGSAWWADSKSITNFQIIGD
jgi:hypothetical protein